jgi:Fe-Mn family superoxide dismutase
MMTRRQALKITTMTTAACAIANSTRFALAQGNAQTTNTTPVPTGPFKLPPLPYSFDALEPHIDARTMEIHHDKHHATYVMNLNKAVADAPDLGKKSVEALLIDLNSVPEKVRTAVRNQGGGHYNHSLFWQMMKKDGGGEPRGDLVKALDKSFNSFSGFKDKFTEAATKVFGSGWAWLVLDGKELKIQPSSNQDSPLSQGMSPLLGIDVWEHAYYLKYQNRRPDYIKEWFNVVNWDFVAQQYEKRIA